MNFFLFFFKQKTAYDILVQQFLDGRIHFLDIQNTIEKVLQNHKPVYQLDLEGILEIDQNVRGDLEI